MQTIQPPTLHSLAGRGRVATLGMFIIDHFQVHDEEGNPVPTDEEAAAMVAARQFLPPTHCSLLIDKGDDFPERFVHDLKSLGNEMVWFRHREGRTTRALNIYSGQRIGEGHQSFKYLSPQRQITPKDLVMPPSPFATPVPPEWIHVVCGVPRMFDIVDELELLKKQRHSSTGLSPIKSRLVWEPLPFSCTPEELNNMISLSSRIAVFSPNLLELQSILSIQHSSTPIHSHVEIAAQQFQTLLLNRSSDSQLPAIIVRAGELGAYTLSTSWTGWVPAFWTKVDQSRIVDVTGGGNSFLGGLVAGLLISDGDIRTASIYASTAASFAIQQRGPPRLQQLNGEERWNGEVVWDRLNEMARRVAQHEGANCRLYRTCQALDLKNHA
ncbi:hypothetical protein I314_00453 [Cryptococcus bacillisporus CA1873]|uniref:Carbohydrate kinase PfkB domain-containing protein n=1 Tax=Cryptococcus bacillisporus CA1873 TaxID=1296111 RepID=A0ABR5BJI9_CRYGA|nr:hypothetical protein I314_00453 [Cryptococcus bacillisporus CA1873]|eukprot:KIR69343.1 hypothetical protein I314_00453 [Cryptococcus gattii CA1873]